MLNSAYQHWRLVRIFSMIHADQVYITECPSILFYKGGSFEYSPEIGFSHSTELAFILIRERHLRIVNQVQT